MSSNTEVVEYQPKYPNLMDADKLRGSLRRLFSNKWDEVFGELLQNSQRAGASQVKINSVDGFITYEDNGHGLLNGIEGFETMLALAVSHFENEKVKDQDPMGLGIHALLANSHVTEVRFMSGNFLIEIDTDKWWNDAEYYKNWINLVKTCEPNQSGMAIRFAAPSKLERDRIECMMLEKDYRAMGYDYSFGVPENPAQGYFDIFEVSFNETSVKTRNKYGWTNRNSFFEFEYQGNKISVDYQQSQNLYINWYGQQIAHKFNGFSVTAHIRTGRPFNPKSPVRSGLIEDSALRDFEIFVEDKLFEFLKTQPQENISAIFLKSLKSLNPMRFCKESPYISVKRVLHSDEKDFDWGTGRDTGYIQRDDAIVIKKNEPVKFLGQEMSYDYVESDIAVLIGNQWASYPHGLATFLKMATSPYYVQVTGVCDIAEKFVVYWKPGKKFETGKISAPFFVEPGVFTIAPETLTAEELDEVDWIPVTKSVIVSEEVGDWFGAASVKVYAPEPIAWLESNEPWIAFTQNDDSDWEDQSDNFQTSLDEIIRDLKGNVVPRIYTSNLHSFFQNKESRIANIRFMKNAEPDGDIEVTNDDGESVKLFFG